MLLKSSTIDQMKRRGKKDQIKKLYELTSCECNNIIFCVQGQHEYDAFVVLLNLLL